MIEEDEIRKGVGNNKGDGKDGGTKKNKKGGEKSNRGKQGSSRAAEDKNDHLQPNQLQAIK